MRRVIAALLLMGGLAVVAIAGADEDKDLDKKKLQATLLLEERQVLEAWKKGDLVGTLNKLADDYAEILPYRSERIVKKDWLKARSEAQVITFQTAGSELTMLGDAVAILTYTLTWDGSPPGKAYGQSTWLVSSTWMRRGERWVCWFRQATEAAHKDDVRNLGDVFEIVTIPNGLRYSYKGPGKLEGVKTTLAVTFPDAQVSGIERYWGAWQTGEIKEVTLNQLVPPTRAIERVDFSGTATLEGRKVRFATVIRQGG